MRMTERMREHESGESKANLSSSNRNVCQVFQKQSGNEFPECTKPIYNSIGYSACITHITIYKSIL